MNRHLIALTLFMGSASTAFAQGVQQPVVSGFSVDTVVSVPDRGTVVIGGVSSGAAGRAMSGPGRFGSGLGRSNTVSGASTSVWIHDFEAMDAALLAEGREPHPAPRLPTLEKSQARTLADHARNVLNARWMNAQRERSVERVSNARGTIPPASGKGVAAARR